ncbi:hypothetical protein ANCCAN_03100, partial [Ancylostoma caninum]
IFSSSSLANTSKGSSSVLKGCEGHDAALAVIRGPISLALFAQHPELHNVLYSCELEKRAKAAIEQQGDPQDYLGRKYEGEYNWYFEYKGDQSDEFFEKAVKSWEHKYNTVSTHLRGSVSSQHRLQNLH